MGYLIWAAAGEAMVSFVIVGVGYKLAGRRRGSKFIWRRVAFAFVGVVLISLVWKFIVGMTWDPQEFAPTRRDQFLVNIIASWVFLWPARRIGTDASRD